MLCTRCKKEQATLFYTQSINGKESSAALCPSCAKQAGIGGANIFAPLFKTVPKDAAIPKNIKRCNLCGLGWQDILSMGKVGCPVCYDTFREELRDTIRSIHGGAKHCGITPEQSDRTVTEKTLSEEDELRNALTAAIQSENYEEAARLRDAIKALKGEN